MKKTHKLLSIAAMVLVLSVAMTMVTAANSLTFSKVEVLNNEGVAVESYSTADLSTADINVQASQILSVTATMTDGAETPAAVPGAAATFLSYLKAVDDPVEEGAEDTSVLDNTTIQFIDQVNTNRDGSVTFTFRPRTSLAKGDYVAKAGGADVAKVAEFSYEVTADLPKIIVTADKGNTLERGRAENDACFTVADYEDEFTAPLENATVNYVKMNGVTLDPSNYSYSYPTLTLYLNYLDELAVGDYDMILSLKDCDQFVLTKAVEVSAPSISSGDTESVQSGLDSAIDVPEAGEQVSFFDVAPSVTGASGDTYDLEYTINTSEKNAVSMENNTIALNEGVDFAKVVVEVNVEGSSTAVTTKTVYLYSENAPAPAFGNVGLHTTGGTDAFKAVESQEAFVSMLNAYGETNKLADIATALNIAINNDKAEELPHFTDALDFDRDGHFTLAEYRIYKLMMDGDDPVHTYAAVQAARPAQ